MPGWKDDSRVLAPLHNCLIEKHGWPAHHVASLSFVNAFGSNIAHASEIATAVNALAAAAPDTDIAIVAHSMGGLALRWYLAHAPHPRVTTAITIGSPHSGTHLAWFIWGAGAAEMRPSSTFLRALGDMPIPAHVRFISLRVVRDTRLYPKRTVTLAGAINDTLPGSGHRRILKQAPACDFIARLLLP